MVEIQTIRRNLALKEYEIKETPDGKQTVFSIRFVKKNGELVFIPRAVAAGLDIPVMLTPSPVILTPIRDDGLREL